MPSSSEDQARFMTTVCKNGDFADKVGVPQDVGCEFHEADRNIWHASQLLAAVQLTAAGAPVGSSDHFDAKVLLRAVDLFFHQDEDDVLDMTDAYWDKAQAVYDAMSGSHREALQLMIDEGPIEDGDVPSKQARDELIEMGFAVRVCAKGSQGFTACNYVGWAIMRAPARSE